MPSPESDYVLQMNRDLRDAWLADPNYTFDDMRRIFEDWLGQFEIPEKTRLNEVTCNGVPCIWADTPDADQSKIIIHYHSGGYILGSAHGYRSFGGFLSAATGAKVLLVDYRLAPENPCPAGVDDGIAAYRWVLEQGFDPSQVVLCGDSGGGGLVLAALQKLRDAGAPMPACGVAISPLADFAFSGESYKENAPRDPLVNADFLNALGQTYCGEFAPTNPAVSPLYGEWSGLPPLMILAGEIEMMRDDGKQCAEAARAAGVDATYVQGEGMAHIWPLYADRLPEARDALATIGTFVRKHMCAKR
ncbi:MAG: alpha/beta hydrolase [Novosphingobium sp.]|nr:alpha/beta hydrolase [Novosphingobium sp.]